MKMPDLSTTDSPIKIIRWIVQPGQSIKRGQPLCEIETDKAASEVESVVAGTLKECRAQTGATINVGEVLAVFETDSRTTSDAAPIAPPVAPAKAAGLFARNRAAAASTSTGPALSQTQQTLGRRMQSSKQNIPHFYLQASANAEPMIRHREAASTKPVWDAFFVAALAKVLPDFERLRWRLNEKGATLSASSDIGVAVEARGALFVVPISAAPGTPVDEISNAIRARVRDLEEGQGAPGIQVAALTITNLGATRVESFAAIINPPEVAILAIGKIGPMPVAVDGRVVVQNRVALTLSADHRVINGRYAAAFLDAVIREIESL